MERSGNSVENTKRGPAQEDEAEKSTIDLAARGSAV